MNLDGQEGGHLAPARLLRRPGQDLLPAESRTTTFRARPGCAGSGFRATHRAVIRLDPDGLQSLAQHSQAGCAGAMTRAARPVAGDRALAEGRQEYLTAL